jgi:hypothetical protein
MRSIGIRVGIIAAIVVGAFILRPFLTGNAGNLSVGDCFDLPTTAAETVKDVQHHPCTEKHDAEVVFVGNYSPVGSTYPTDDEFKTFFQDTCTQAFDAYTGLTFATDTTYDMSAFSPTQEGWTGGDHKVICYAVRIDNSQMTTSVKKA